MLNSQTINKHVLASNEAELNKEAIPKYNNKKLKYFYHCLPFTTHGYLCPAFTLAEVLITLGIIGVVAAMTIPTLVQTYKDTQYKTAYKKAYSSIVQAFLKASEEGDIVEMTGAYGSIGGDANFLALKKQFKVSKSCLPTTADMPNCWNTSGELWRTESNGSHSFIDSSGFAWRTRNADGSNLFPAILVDTNGSKKPNKYGQDRFPFVFAKENKTNFGDYSFLYITGIGLPTKIMPLEDIIVADDVLICPSYASHPCYYTSWLFNK